MLKNMFKCGEFQALFFLNHPDQSPKVKITRHKVPHHTAVVVNLSNFYSLLYTARHILRIYMLVQLSSLVVVVVVFSH